jgi:hypothetical protein
MRLPRGAARLVRAQRRIRIESSTAGTKAHSRPEPYVTGVRCQASTKVWQTCTLASVLTDGHRTARATLQRTSFRKTHLNLVAAVWRGPDHLDHETLDLRSSAQRSGSTSTAVGCRASEVVAPENRPNNPPSPNLQASGRAAPNADRTTDRFGQRTAPDPQALINSQIVDDRRGSVRVG